MRSYDTVHTVMRAVMRHADADTLDRIVADLVGVPGNASFRATIQRLAIAVEAEKKRRAKHLKPAEGDKS
jgi:hypothetical protein